MIIWRWIFHPLWVGCVCGVGYPWQRLLFGLVLSGVCFVRRVTMATPIGRSGGSTNGAGHWHVVWLFFFFFLFLVLLFCFPGTAGQPDPFTISWSPRCRVCFGGGSPYSRPGCTTDGLLTRYREVGRCLCPHRPLSSACPAARHPLKFIQRGQVLLISGPVLLVPAG